jgi:hypothetical protein
MPYRLVLVDRFLLIIGSGMVLAFMFIISGAYYLTKLYYFMQMSSDTTKISKMILQIFFFGIFIPMMILFFANEMAIPLWGGPSPADMAAYEAGNLPLSLMQNRLNTGGLYLAMMAIVGVTYLLYLVFEKWMHRKNDEELASDRGFQSGPQT